MNSATSEQQKDEIKVAGFLYITSSLIFLVVCVNNVHRKNGARKLSTKHKDSIIMKKIQYLKEGNEDYFEIIQGIPEADQIVYTNLFVDLCELNFEKRANSSNQYSDLDARIQEQDKRYNLSIKDKNIRLSKDLISVKYDKNVFYYYLSIDIKI